MLNLRDAIKCITIGGEWIDMIEWTSRTKGFTVIFVSYSWVTSSVLNMLSDICVHLQFMPLLIAPAVKLERKPFAALHSMNAKYRITFKGMSFEGKVKSFDKNVYHRRSPEIFFSLHSLLSRYRNGINFNVYLLESESNQNTKNPLHGIAYKMIVDNIFLFVFELYISIK